MVSVMRPTMMMMFLGSRTCRFTSHVLPEDEDEGECDVVGGVALVMNHALHDVVHRGLNHVLLWACQCNAVLFKHYCLYIIVNFIKRLVKV